MLEVAAVNPGDPPFSSEGVRFKSWRAWNRTKTSGMFVQRVFFRKDARALQVAGAEGWARLTAEEREERFIPNEEIADGRVDGGRGLRFWRGGKLETKEKESDEAKGKAGAKRAAEADSEEAEAATKKVKTEE